MQDSAFEPRLSTGDRVLTALVRLAWIAVVGIAVVAARSTALSAAAAAAQPVQPFGDWKEVRGSKGGLVFTPDGRFRETFAGVTYRRGSFQATKGVIRVTDLHDDKGPIRQIRHHAERTLDVVEYRVNLTDESLTVRSKREEWRADDGDLYVEDWFPPRHYIRRKDPQPAPPPVVDDGGFLK